MLLIKNIKVLTAADKNYDKADILVQKGKIVRIEECISEEGCEVIDGTGLTAAPGFIDAHTHLGMWEDAIEFEGADGNEMTDPVTPEMRAIDGINPMDRTFEDAYTGGVTSVGSGPGSSNVIGGQFAAIKTWGICIDDMIIKAPAAIKCALERIQRESTGMSRERPL